MTLGILGDTEAVARISESLAALGRGEPGADLATVRPGLARASRKQSPPPCWNSASPPSRSIRTAVGKPLFGPLAGCHGARRGTYRIVHRIDETTRTVRVLDIDHRAEIYRPHS